jgi:hypothetical protein
VTWILIAVRGLLLPFQSQHCSWEVPLPQASSSDRLLRVLLKSELPPTARYGLATVAVLFAAAIRWALPVNGVPYLLFLPILMAASLGLGLGAGLYATLLSAVVATWISCWSAASWSPPARLCGAR